MGETGRLGDSGAALIAHVRQRLLVSRRAVRVVPARLRETLVTAAFCVRLVLSARRPKGQRGLSLALDRQIVVCRRGRILMLKGGGRVRRVAPGLLRVPDYAGLRIVALGGDVQRLRRVGADRGGRGAGGRRWRSSRRSRGRATRRRRVRLLVERAAHPVGHHGPPGRAGGVAGGGRWRRSRVARRAEAPDMVVRVQGGGRASHGGAGESPDVHARREHIARTHASTPQRHMKIKTRFPI